MTTQRLSKIRIAAVACCASFVAAPAGAAVLLQENFDGLALGPFVSPTETGGDGTDWTSTAPAGWVRDNSTTPVGNPVEFLGWNFMAKDAWIATEGNQARDQFALGSGTVMVTDPDAYDDGTNIDTGLFNAFISIAPVSLLGIQANSVTLEFDSSFRAEATQIAMVEVSYNGGANYTNLMTLDGTLLEAVEFQHINERRSFNLSNPGSGSMLVRFSMTQGSNDWWWAVDNVSISGTPVPEPTGAALSLAALTGLAFRRRRA
jgi:MYXO-CTERM domain-containing protein